MKKSVAKKWVAALRSGEYNQTQKELKNEDGYCCLGVLCSISPWKNNFTRMIVSPYGKNVLLPAQVCKWAGVRSNVGKYKDKGDTLNRSLAARNDEGMSFNEIADLIEKYTEDL